MINYNHDFINQMGGAEGIKNAVESGDINRVMASMDPETAAKIKAVIADRDAAERLLRSPQAQQLMKMFLKENK